MKKSIIAGIIAIVIFSLDASGQVSFGVKGGLNLSNIKLSESGISITPNNLAGFHVGVIADIPVAANLYVQPGLFLTQKGFKYSVSENINVLDDDYNISIDLTAKPLYVELPVLLSYRLPVSNGLSVALEAGPYVAYGIGGNEEVKASASGESITESVKFFDDSGTNRFDAGAQFGLGLYVGRFMFGAAYQMGLVNISPSEETELSSDLIMESAAKAVNRNIVISVGFRF